MSNVYVQIVQSRSGLSSVIDDQELGSITEKLLARIAATDGVGQTLEHLKTAGASVLSLVCNEATER